MRKFTRIFELFAVMAAMLLPFGLLAAYLPVGVFTKYATKDCLGCPEMVLIEHGQFAMGSNTLPWSAPRRVVHVKRDFMMSRNLVTFDEWDLCVRHGGCSFRPPEWDGCLWDARCLAEASDKTPGLWARGKRPVVNVSWHDAQTYVAWLSKTTGQRYRLPSEAEWEYAARGFHSTKLHERGPGLVEVKAKNGFVPLPEQSYFWGESISREHANYGRAVPPDSNKLGGAIEGADKWLTTSPVGSFPPNALGLYDMAGNVWQWVEDCFAPYVSGARTANAVTACPGSSRVMRGGSWYSPPEHLHVAQRNHHEPDYRMHLIGFRVVKGL